MELHDAEEAMGMRKILAHNIRMKKNPQTKEDTFWILTDFHGIMRVQSSTCMEISSMASLTPKSPLCRYFYKYFVLTVFFFKPLL